MNTTATASTNETHGTRRERAIAHPHVSTPRPRPALGGHAPIPLTRLIAVELRKMFDTRSGLWLLVGLGASALLTSGAIIAWAPRDQLTHNQFILAIGVPMTVILPIIAALSVTSEWSQRTGLATFTLVPHRGRILFAKAVASVLVTLPSTVVAVTVGAAGNLTGAAMSGADASWDFGTSDAASFALARTLLLLVGFMFGTLIRNSAGAVVAYMIYAFVLPGLLVFLAMNQAWFADAQPWIDLKHNQDTLLRGSLAGDQWTQLAVTVGIWLVVPMLVAVTRVLRSEVK